MCIFCNVLENFFRLDETKNWAKERSARCGKEHLILECFGALYRWQSKHFIQEILVRMKELNFFVKQT